MKMIILVGIAFSICLASVSFAAHVEVQGHRGARGSRPENTLPAFQFALEQGVDTLELDIAVSADNQLVISHDPDMTAERCLDPSGNKLASSFSIHSLKYDEIKKYDCGSLVNEKFPHQMLVPHTPKPRLEDLFVMIEKSKLPNAKKIKFNIETKIYPSKPERTPEPKVFARAIIEMGRKHHMISRMILQSFDDRTLLAAKEIEPKLLTAMLTSDNHIDYVAVAKSAKADIISPAYDWIFADDVKKMHASRIEVLPWTVNTPEDWDHMIELGVDGIITDYPQELIAYLRAKGLR